MTAIAAVPVTAKPISASRLPGLAVLLVLAGWALGTLTGWYAHSRDNPLILSVLPHGFMVGYKKSF